MPSVRMCLSNGVVEVKYSQLEKFDDTCHRCKMLLVESLIYVL